MVLVHMDHILLDLLANPRSSWSWYSLWPQTLVGWVYGPVWVLSLNQYMNLHYYQAYQRVILANLSLIG